MIRSGLIGRNITASRSPWLHEEEARAQGLSLTYELFDFTARAWPDAHLRNLLAQVAADGFAGVNVTYPFKQAVIPFLDALADSAALVGAVNTIAIRDGRLTGHNTDYSGFRQNLLDGLDGDPLGHVLQLGAGGAGSAVASALLSAKAESLAIFDVDHGRAAELVARMAERFPGRTIAALDHVPVEFGGIDGIVNTTPIGMAAYPGTPIGTSALRPSIWVADIVYFPLETALLGAARAAGCRTIDGSGMVIAQAALAFEIITDHPADALRMKRSFDIQAVS